jgi:hypothetical protein
VAKLAVVRRSGRLVREPDALFAARTPARKLPFDFAVEALAEAAPETKPMFGSTAVYVGDKIVFILRQKAGASARDGCNGVWIATTEEHHASLRRELPGLRSIAVFGDGTTGWQMLAAEDDGFEEQVLRACELGLAGDERIGKVPKSRRPRGPRAPGRNARAISSRVTSTRGTKVAATAKAPRGSKRGKR